MAAFREERQEIVFPDDWEVVRYEDSDHARRLMQNWRFKIRTRKAKVGAPSEWTPNPLSQAVIDFVAWVPASAQLLLIEIRDYRQATAGGDQVPAELADWVAWKARDAMAGLAVAATCPESDLHDFARRALTATRVRVFVDVKWPPTDPVTANRRRDQQLNLSQKLGPLSKDSFIIDPTVTVPWQTKDLAQ
jgi:hypothetical protein